jgi:hypothetical protein
LFFQRRRQVVFSPPASQVTFELPVTFSQPRNPFTPGGKDGTADRFRGHPVHFPADFSNMTSLGFFCTVPALSLDSELKGSLTSKHSRSTAGTQ